MITVTAVSGLPSGNIGTAYEFGPHGTTFTQPVTISINYDEAILPSGTIEADLKLGIFVNNIWQAVTNSTVDTGNNIVSGTTTSFSFYGIIAEADLPLIPAVPTGITATAGDGTVTITWDAVPNATSYNLYMASQGGVTKSNYSSLPDAMKHSEVSSPFTHTCLTNGTTYYFVVTAVNSAGESTESAEVSTTPTPSTSPTVWCTHPADGAIRVPHYTGIFVSFNRAMDPTTITSSTFLLSGPNNTLVPGEITYPASGTGTVFFSPSINLSLSTTYKVTLTSEIKDLEGNPLDDEYTWSFTTDTTGLAFSPQVAMDANGNVMATWVQYDGEYYSIYANRYVVGTGWQGAVLIETVTGDANQPRIVMNGNGDAIVAWWGCNTAGHAYCFGSKIYAARYAVGSGWETAVQIARNDDFNSIGIPSLAIDASGNAMAVWPGPNIEIDESVSINLWASRYEVGKEWQEPILIENNAENVNTQKNGIAMDMHGNLIVVWSHWKYDFISQTFANSIWARRYVDGEGWEGPTQLVTSPDSLNHWQVVTDALGNATLLWEWARTDGMAGGIYAKRYDVGAGWGPDTLIESEYWGSIDFNAAGNNAGNIMIVWGWHIDVYAKQYEPDKGWGATIQIASEGIRSHIAMGNNGDAMAVWEAFDGTDYSIYASRYEFGVGWEPPSIIESSSGGGTNSRLDAASCRVAVDPNGNTVAVWELIPMNMGISQIWANRFEAGSGWGEATLIQN
jgi:hypothetical protein